MAKRASTSVIKRRSKSLAEYVGLLKKMSVQIDRFHHRTDCSEQSRSFHRIGPHRGGKNIVYSTRCLRSIAVSSDVSRNIRDPLGLGGIFDSGSFDDKLIGEECLCDRRLEGCRPRVGRTFPDQPSRAISIFTCQTQSSRPLAKRIFPSGKTRRRLSGGLRNFRYTWRSRLRAARRTLFTRCRCREV